MSVFMLEGKLVNCHRTPEGVEAVSSGKVQLDARQRQFWLVVDKEDIINQQICEKLAEKINIKAFIDAGLLAIENSFSISKSNASQSESGDIKQLNEDTERLKTAVALQGQLESPIEEDEALFVDRVKVTKKSVDASEIDAVPISVRFDWVKSTMCSSLSKTSGLLATDVIESIERAKNATQLVSYIARWRTTMLDSSYDRDAIDTWVEQVKYALHTLTEQPAYAS